MTEINLTKEERDAWLIAQPLILRFANNDRSQLVNGILAIDAACVVFDRLEKTAGIEPLSKEHAGLILQTGGWGIPNEIANTLRMKKLISDDSATDYGDAVCAELNKQCGGDNGKG